MNNLKIIERIKVLYASLQYCSTQMKVFTVGERICINQERLQWLHILNTPTASPKPISAKIELKINEIKNLISFSSYTSDLTDPLLEEILSIDNFTYDTKQQH